MESDGTVIVVVLLLAFVVRAIGYRSEPWWSRWGSAAILAVLALLDLAGVSEVDFVAVPAAVLFVVSLVVHVLWRLGENGRPWTMPRVRTKSRGDAP